MGKRLIYAKVLNRQTHQLALIADLIQCWFITVLSSHGIDLAYFNTDRDQRSIFLGFEFPEPIFFGYWSQPLYFLGC